MKKLNNPPAHKRPIPKPWPTIQEILKLPYEESMTALLDYDGPIRSLLERMLSTEPEYVTILMPKWKEEAKGIMNVVYKLNGLKQIWPK